MSVKDKHFELIQTICELAEELGWNIIIPKNNLSEDEGEPLGLIMGTPAFMDDIHMDPEQIEEVIEFDSVAQKAKGNLH